MRTSFTLTLLTLCVNLFAGGFETQFRGTRQLGMGGIGTSVLQDASGLLYNPATVSFLKERFSFSFSNHLYSGKTVFYDPGTDASAATIREPYYVPGLAVSYKVNQEITVGLSYYKPLSVHTNWEDDWRGRYLSSVHHMDVRFLQPSVSVKLGDRLSLGGGLIIASSSIELERDLPISNATGSRVYSSLGANAGTAGIKAGIYFQPTEKWGIGADFNSQMRFDYKNGNASFFVPSNIEDDFPETSFSTITYMPTTFSVGVTSRHIKGVQLSMEIDAMQWTVEDFVLYDFVEESESLADIEETAQYDNSYRLKFGAQYQPSCCFILRAGLSFYNSPANDRFFSPKTPDLNRVGLHGGFSYSINEWLTFDGALVWYEGKTTQAVYSPTDFNGFYKSRTQAGSLGVQIIF